jgi:hypothetical protein
LASRTDSPFAGTGRALSRLALGNGLRHYPDQSAAPGVFAPGLLLTSLAGDVHRAGRLDAALDRTVVSSRVSIFVN